MIVLSSVLYYSCNDDDPPLLKDVTLNITGLKDLGSDYNYTGWLLVNNNFHAIGSFTVNEQGQLSGNSFPSIENLTNNASKFLLTIEQSQQNPNTPSNVKILAGSFTDNSATLSVGDASALGTDFSSATGSYILATPTNGSSNNEKSGVWFLDNTSNPPVAGLSLPTLPSGWKYEGWVVINNTPVTTGKFTSTTGADLSAPFSGDMSGPAFPGEDFITDAPSELTFPVDLDGAKVVISVEPEPDNSTEPFLLKPLVGDVPSSATDHTKYDLSNNANATNPTGAVTISRTGTAIPEN